MPELYDGPPPGGKGVVRPPRKPNEPIHKAPEPAQQVADATEVSASRMREIFNDINEATVYHLPDTLTYTAGTKNDVVTSTMADEYLSFLGQSVGGEHLGPFLGAEAITDPAIRENVIATYNELRGLSYGSVPYVPGQSLTRTYTDEELAQMAMEGADLSKLSPTDRGRLVGVADDLLNSLQALPTTGVATDAMQTAVAVGVTGDLSLALSPDQLALLEKVKAEFGELSGLRQTGETLPLAGIGIEQVSQRGGHLIVFHDGWVKAHPDEAFATKLALEAEFPDLQIEFGAERGVPGWILNKLGAAVDYVSAPFGAGVQHFNEYGESIFTSDEERARAAATADELEQALARGEVPEDKVQETINSITDLRDKSEVTVGMDVFAEQMYQNANPRFVGMGFADSYVKSMSVQPGDPNYGLMYGSAALLANIVADPTTWITGGLAGLRAARLAPRFASAVEATGDARLAARAAEVAGTAPEISRSWIRQSVYNRLVKSPEEILVTKPYRKATDVLWAVRERLGQERFGSFLATYFQDARGLGGDTKVADFLAGATTKEDLQWSLVATQAGPGAELPNVARMETRLSEVTRQIDELGATDDLIAERAWLNDALHGRDWVRPMRQVFNSKQLRKLNRRSKKLGPITPEARILEAATESVETVSDDFLRAGNVADATPEMERTSRNLIQRWHDWWRPTGFGELLVFPGTSPEAKALRGTRLGVDDVIRRLRATNTNLTMSEARNMARKIVADSKVLADGVEDSFGHIVNVGRQLGLSESRIQELMRPWVAQELGTPAKNYQWWTKTWETMVNESPRLRQSDKADLGRMWDSLVNERSASYVQERLPNGTQTADPTWYRAETNPKTGEVTHFPVPAFEADQFQTWRVPSADDMHQYLSTVQRTMNEWRKQGGWVRSPIAIAHFGITQGFQSFTNLWKSVVLGTRITALPARIVSEEMLRSAALDYSSLVWHPWEWFMSTKLGTRVSKNSDFALMGESPVEALGAAVNSVAMNPNMRLARNSRNDILLADEQHLDAFFRSYADRVGRMYASPSSHLAVAHLDDPQRALDAIRRGPDADSFEATVATTSHTPLEAVERMQETIRQSIGTGPNAPLVEVALRRGEVLTPDGELVRAGTVEFAAFLRKSYDEGTWIPGATKLNRSSGDYLVDGRWRRFSEFTHIFRDNLFGMIYTKPDLALARSPLWRQMAAREFRNLVRKGYDAETAKDLAKAYAARGTADMLFTIGAKTSGEYFLRNWLPFFPAYREIANTWLIRVPQRIGSGTWALGAVTLARRAEVWTQFFKNVGWLKQDENGEWIIPLPIFKPIMSAVLGKEVNARAPAESLAGLFPIDMDILHGADASGRQLSINERVRGFLPSLGGSAGIVLAAANKVSGGTLDDVEQWTTLMGADSSLGPISVDRFFEAFGIYPPWMSNTTKDMHEALRHSAVMDGMRLAWDTHAPKDWTTFDKDGDGYLNEEEAADYAKEHGEEIRAWLEQGERYATNLYLMKGVAAMTLPFSLSVTNEDKQLTTAMFGLLDAVPKDDSFASAWISSFMAEYPNLQPYMARKTVDLRPGIVKPDESLDEFFNAVEKGDIKFRDPYDFAVFAAGMNSYSIYQSRVDAIYEEAGDSPGEWMLNFDAKEEIADLKANWDHFLDLSEDYDPTTGQSKSFQAMFDEYFKLRAIHEGEKPNGDLTLEQQRLLEFDGMMREYALKLVPGEPSSESYYKLREEAFNALGDPTTKLGKGVAWAFENIMDPYFAGLDKLYNKLDGLNEWQKPAVYEEIRQYRNSYNKEWKHPTYGSFPGPEEYYFAKLKGKERRAQITEWANLPAGYLTQFQREQVGYDIPKGKQDEADKLGSFIAEKEEFYHRYVEEKQTSYSATAVVELRERLDREIAAKADKLGLSAYHKQMNDPDYRRIDRALGLSEQSPAFARIAGYADRLITAWEGAGINLGGTTAEAKNVHIWLAGQVRTLRRDNQEFDKIMEELRYALGDDGQPLGDEELVVKLFFDVYDTSHAYYLDKDKGSRRN